MFFFLSIIAWPVVAAALVGAYGLAWWSYQVLASH
jgi:nitrate reductase NapE component